MMNKETLKEAGYEYVRYDRWQCVHVLRNVETRKLEAWGANKNHAGYGIKWRNTHLEYCREYKEE